MSEAMLKDFITRYKAMIADLEKSVEGFEKELAEVTDNSVVVDEEFMKNPSVICERIYGDYANKAVCLSRKFNWELKEDSSGIPCLIPTKKGATK